MLWHRLSLYQTGTRRDKDSEWKMGQLPTGAAVTEVPTSQLPNGLWWPASDVS